MKAPPQQARYDEPILFDQATPAGPGAGSKRTIPLRLPDLTESQVVRHFTRLSQMTHGVDSGPYPLGSCTMKLNPKVADWAACQPGFLDAHPALPAERVQGALEVLWRLEQALRAISGMDGITFQPQAGAQGEFVGLLVVRAYLAARGEDRDEVVLPDSAHGTNPASAAMAGFKVIEIPSKEGCVDLDALRAAVGPRTAAFMLTNPNTLGVFEHEVEAIASIVHAAGAQLYYDGANLNAIVGKTSPGAMGFDVMHFNLHKTFATPHGGGGPGAGPVGVKEHLLPFLPHPRVERREDGSFRWLPAGDASIGHVADFAGQFLVCLRALTYILLHGGVGLARKTELAVANAEYLKRHLPDAFTVPYPHGTKHEFVASAAAFKERGVRALDLAKGFLDAGIHAPTMYFPLIVEEAMMFEPTEDESLAGLDAILAVLREMVAADPVELRSAPQHTARSRVDEVRAARMLKLNHFDVRS